MTRRSRVRQWRGGGPYSLGLHRHDQVNRALGGGLPRGSLVLLTGETGAGKSAFAGRFAHGLCSESHPVTLLSTDRPVRRFLSQMRALGYEVGRHLARSTLLYLHGDVGGVEGEPARELLARLTASERMWAADVVLLDSFDEVLRYDAGFDRLQSATDRRQAARRVVSFLSSITDNGRTVVVTLDPTGLPEPVVDPFRRLADCVLELVRQPTDRTADRWIDVRRFAGTTAPVDDRIQFRIRPGAGIVIDDRTVVRL